MQSSRLAVPILSGRISYGGTIDISTSPSRTAPFLLCPITLPFSPAHTVLKKQLPVTSLQQLASLSKRGKSFSSHSALTICVDSFAVCTSLSSLLNGLTLIPHFRRLSLESLVSTIDAIWLYISLSCQ